MPVHPAVGGGHPRRGIAPHAAGPGLMLACCEFGADGSRPDPAGARGFHPLDGARLMSFGHTVVRRARDRGRPVPARARTPRVRSVEALQRLHHASAGHVTALVRIDYYPPRGDNKEGWDNIDIFGWLGYPMQIKVDFLCRASILAVPLALDGCVAIPLARQGRNIGAPTARRPRRRAKRRSSRLTAGGFGRRLPDGSQGGPHHD